MTLLLEDYSLEIPPFLRRGADNRLKYPGLPVAEFLLLPGSVTENEPPRLPPDPSRPNLTQHDLDVIAALRLQETHITTVEREQKREAGAERRAAEKAKRDQKAEKVRLQKQAAFQHFKWSFDK